MEKLQFIANLAPLIAIIVCVGVAGWVVTTWIRAKHGYPIDEWSDGSGSGEIETRRAAELMARENEQLKGQIGRLEERIATLERIATDPAERISREIDGLR